jgi:CHAD domain-containing protein
MKSKAKKIIGERYEGINKYLKKPNQWFDSGHIHSFRLEVKKLNSFLGLLSVGADKIKLPKRLKEVYKILGRIRMIQLQEKNVFGTAKDLGIDVPVRYLVSLKIEKAELKKRAKDLVENIRSLKAKKLGWEMPRLISSENAGLYLGRQENSLSELITSQRNDKSLHEVRKILKNMLYDLPFLKHEMKERMEFSHDNTHQMKSLESNLGAFHDISLSLQQLTTALNGQYEGEEREILKSIQQQWLKNKDHLRNRLDFSRLIITGKEHLEMHG